VSGFLVADLDRARIMVDETQAAFKWQRSFRRFNVALVLAGLAVFIYGEFASADKLASTGIWMMVAAVPLHYLWRLISYFLLLRAPTSTDH
jgi:hypothetical protein